MFVQIMDCRLKPGTWDEFMALNEEWERKEGHRAPGYLGDDVVRDRNDPNRVLMIARFESPELAQQNSNRPETNAMYQRLVQLLEREPTFIDCDLVQELRPTTA